MRAFASLRRFVTASTVLALVVPAVACAEPPPVIPREVFFAPPDRLQPQLSPDGKLLAYISRDAKGLPHLWMRTVGKDDDRQVSAGAGVVADFIWAHDNRTLLFVQDRLGNDGWHVFGLDLPTGNVRDYTPVDGIQARLLAVSPKRPVEVLVTGNLRDRMAIDVYRVHLGTGALVLDTENPGRMSAFVADAELRVRAALAQTPEGFDVLVRDDDRSLWRLLTKVGAEETLQLVGFSGDGKSLAMVSSVGSDTSRVIEKDITSGAEKVVATSAEADVDQLLVNPATRVIEAVAFAPDRRRWTVTSTAVKADLAALAKVSAGELEVLGRDRDDEKWVVSFESDTGPTRFYVWDRAAKKATFLFSDRKALEGVALAPMKAVTIPARDGLKLRGYLTLPVGVRAKKLPLVLVVHSGPWARDRWGFNPDVQWLANRGYACLQVNYRGSAGLGKKLMDAGDGEWGRKMQHDLVDAVAWATKQGIADEDRVAIFGSSYGGYAALAGVTLTPDVFAAAVDVSGPSSIETVIRSIPSHWESLRARFKTRVGDVESEADRRKLAEVSPVNLAERIRVPVLIAQGASDTRARSAETERIVAAVEKNGGKAVLVTYPDEGHGLARRENYLDFLGRAESFLAKTLAGRAEPLAGEKHPGSTAVVRAIGF